MGSLLSGWDAPVHDPKMVKFMRNKSLTKEEIEAYWRSKRKTEEEHIEAIYISTYAHKKGLITKPTPTFRTVTKQDFETYMDRLIKKNTCWWTRSNSAFLNEPPVTGEGSKQNYVSQHRIASGFVSTKPDSGIST